MHSINLGIKRLNTRISSASVFQKSSKAPTHTCFHLSLSCAVFPSCSPTFMMFFFISFIRLYFGPSNNLFLSDFHFRTVFIIHCSTVAALEVGGMPRPNSRTMGGAFSRHQNSNKIQMALKNKLCYRRS